MTASGTANSIEASAGAVTLAFLIGRSIMSGRIYDADWTELTPDRKNANTGSKRGREAHQQSLERLGAGRSILIDRDNEIIAGNKTAEVAHELGIPIRIIETHGDELIAVKRLDMDLDDPDSRAREMAYADNIVSQLNLHFSRDVIAEDRAAGVGNVEAYWSDDDLKALGLAGKDGDGGEAFGDFATMEERTRTIRPGDTVLLGTHTLIVGAQLDEADAIIDAWEGFTGEQSRVTRGPSA